MAERPGTLTLGAGFAAVVTIWGLNYLFVRAGLDLAAPLWLAALRAGIGAIGVSVFLLPRPRTPPLGLRARGTALLLGVPNTALFFGLWFLGATQVMPGETAVVIYTFPLWVAILAGPLLRDRLGGLAWAAVLAGFVGVALLSQPWAGGASSLRLLPVAELLAGSVSWAVGTVLMKRYFRPPQLLEANAYQMLGGAAALLAAAVVISPGAIPAPTLPLLGDVLWLGLVGTAVAYSIWFYLLGRVPVSTLTGFTFAVPLVALGASAVVFGERLDVVQGLGVLLVVLAIIVVGRRAVPDLDPPAE
jgi:drug/metabolite transporter (DMT)-like permease